MPIADQIAIVAAAIAFGSAVISVLGIYMPWRNTHDSEVFREAVIALERAYRALTQDGTCISPPAPDRLNWLTAARHIEAYKSLWSKLKTDLYKQLCLENEEHWRHQFYLSILKNRIHQVSYFESGPLEPRSTIIIFAFAAWPKGKPDRIEALDIEALFSNSELLQGNVGLRTYLERLPEYGRET